MMMTQHQSRPQRRASGFTIIELLVAAAVTIIMMVLVGQLFTSTTNAVSSGAATSDIIGSVEAFASQLRLDAEAMVGPHGYFNPDDATVTPFTTPLTEGGILVIVSQQLGDWDNDGVLDGDSDGDGIVEPLAGETPAGEGFVQPLQGGGEIYRTVRFDQLVFVRTRDASQYAICSTASDTFTSYDDAGLAQFSRVWYGHPKTAALNSAGTALSPSWSPTAVHLMLGRQELFLGEETTAVLPTCLATGTYAFAPVSWTGDTPPWATWQVWNGLTDYAYAALYDHSTNPHPNGAIVGGTQYASTDQNYRLWNSLPDVDLGTPVNGYAGRAVAYYTYTPYRLIAAEKPLKTSTGPELATWAVNQMHPNMLTHCSDFVVEFAGDYSPRDGEIDTDAEGIIWYAGIASVEDLARNVQVISNTATLPTYVTGVDNEGVTGLPYRAYVFRHDDYQSWNSTSSTGSYWPYLIRARYRMHDTRGQLRSDGDQYGVWFEHVIKVRRP